MRAIPAPAHCRRVGAPGQVIALTGSGDALTIRSTSARSVRPGMKKPLAPARLQWAGVGFDPLDRRIGQRRVMIGWLGLQEIVSPRVDEEGAPD